MVFRTIEVIEMSYEVKKDKQGEIARKLQETYPDLKISTKDNKINVSGDLHNYKKRDNIMYILSGGKHGKSISNR